MPYIDQVRRRELDSGDGSPGNAGELNYAVTTLVREFLGDHPRYDDFNAAIGALECAKLELYRRMVAPVCHGGKRTAISEYGERQFRTKSYTDFG